MTICASNDKTCASGSTSVREAASATIPERLRANAGLPDVDDFLRLHHASRDDECFSYGAVLDAAERFAAHYRGRGLARGDRVVIVLEHSLDLYAAFLGALLGGFVPSIWSIPSPKMARSDYAKMLAALIDNVRPNLLVTSAALRDRVVTAEALQDRDTCVCVAGEVAADPGPRVDDGACDPDDVAFLQHSSGTTGLKKGVALSHRALLWQVDRYAEAIRLCPDDKIVSWLPLYHDMGLIACCLLPFVRKVPLVAMCPFEWVRRPATWLRAVSEFGGTLAWLPNFAYSFLARSVTEDELDGIDLSSLRGVVNCSEPLLARSHDQFVGRFDRVGFRASALCGSYALAENTFAVTSGGFDAPLARDCIDGPAFARTGRAVPTEPSAAHARVLVSSGRALPETQIKIVGEDGQPLADRQLGQIVLRSPCLLSAYYRNEAATREAVRDGEYATGDVGYLADGELFVTGRKKDMLIIRGQNIYPQDVEAVVNETPGVIAGRTAAVGVPNEQLGTEDLVILAETDEAEPSARDAMRRRILERVAAATDATPADVRLLEHMWLRKSSSGKISRAINRDRYLELIEREQQAAPEGPAAPAPAEPASTVAAVRRCVEGVLAQTRMGRAISVKDDDSLIRSGAVDSLGLVSLIHAVEADCHVSIPVRAMAAMSHIDTLRGLADLVDRIRAGEVTNEKLETFPRRPEDVPLVIGEPRSGRTRGGVSLATRLWSWYYRRVLRRRGVRVGRGLRVLGPLILRFDGDPRNIAIGDDVTLMPYVDLKIRENGRIILHDGVVLDTMARLVAANDARIELGEDVQVAIGTVINAGEDVIVGRRTAIAGFCTIVASEHKYLSKSPVMQQGYRHDPVYIGEDVWVAANVFVGRGSRIGHGAVLGVKSVVRGDVPAYAVVMGNPGRVVRFRG